MYERTLLMRYVFLAVLCFGCGSSTERVQSRTESIVTTYSASADFSSFQPANGWSYVYGNAAAPTAMTWIADVSWPGGGYWKGNETYLIIGQQQVHPGNSGDSIRQWTASAVGNVVISGTVHDTDSMGSGCGDGVDVSILRDGLILWRTTILNGDSVGQSYSLRASVIPGTVLSFVVSKRSDNGCDSTFFDPLIVHTSGSSAVNSASAEFSSNQGDNGWYYGYDTGGVFTPMTWQPSSSSWQGNEMYLLVWNNGMHPGNSSDAVRRWIAPSDGMVQITGNATDQNTTCGDGVIVKIKKDDDLLWQQTVANGDTVGNPFSLVAYVHGGAIISFMVNRNGDSNCDGTNLDPVITFTNSEFCVDCLQIRVGRPLYNNGPRSNVFDAPTSILALSNGQYRGFGGGALGGTTNGFRYADSLDPWSLTGSLTLAVQHGALATDWNGCGSWITDIERLPSYTLALVHGETKAGGACVADYSQKSMGVAYSYDEGATFTTWGKILSGQDGIHADYETGVGDCQVVNRDGFLYAYCTGYPPHTTTVNNVVVAARAPISNPGPGQWKFWKQGGWDSPGLTGDATPVTFQAGNHATSNSFSARYVPFNAVANIGGGGWSGTWPRAGTQLAFSRDLVSFVPVKEPILLQDWGRWMVVDPLASDYHEQIASEIIAYQSMVSLQGGDAWSGSFLFYYTYVPPYGGVDDQYLAVRDVYVSLKDTPQVPQVGVELSRWMRTASTEYWTTTAVPVRSTTHDYTYQTNLGYLMTLPPTGATVNKLEECAFNNSGHYDHLVALQGTCLTEGTRLRTLGWVYQTSQPNTRPLYNCYNSTWQSHFASNSSACEGLGTMQSLLGYILDQ